MLGCTPLTEEVIVTLELPSREEQGTTATPMYSSRDEYKITTTPRKERKLEEVVATSKFLGQIELASSSTLMLEEGIPIIKEQAMLTPNFSCQTELGSASAHEKISVVIYTIDRRSNCDSRVTNSRVTRYY